MKIKDLDTPSLILDEKILKNNIKKMAVLAEKANVKLRPHIKAHKCTEILKIQLHYGAKGITVAKLEEAEVMLKTDIKDILIAYPLIGDAKLKKLAALIKKGVKITCLVDGWEQVQVLNQLAINQGIKIPLYVEVDTGLNRTGLQPNNVVEFIYKLHNYSGVVFSGILTHAGHVYGSSKERVSEIGKEEGLIMEKVAKGLNKIGFEGFDVSVGATPTVKYSAWNSMVTEIRPGNYVFNDAIQVGLGVVQKEECSLKVLTTVISRPASDRLVIDAGSKTLALDKGAHGNNLVNGFGIFVDYPNLILERLSEEHGIVKINPGKVPRIGEKLFLIPNHACPVVNLADNLIIVNENDVLKSWTVDARGKNK